MLQTRTRIQKTSFDLEPRFFLLLALALVLFLIAQAISNGWVLFLSALIISSCSLALLLPFLILSCSKPELSGPEIIEAGEPIPLSIQLKMPTWLAGLSGPIMLQCSNEPGAAKSLVENPRAINQLMLNSHAQVRGIRSLPELTLETSYPFGLAWCRISFKSDAKLVVLPSCMKLEGKFLYKLSALSFVPGDSGGSSRGFESAGCRGIREYRRGDSRRQIHWNSSARHGSLIVKEREREGLPAFDLILDPNSDFASFESFELAVSAAASILKLGHKLGVHPELFVSSQEIPETEKIGKPTRIHDLREQLTALASLPNPYSKEPKTAAISGAGAQESEDEHELENDASVLGKERAVIAIVGAGNTSKKGQVDLLGAILDLCQQRNSLFCIFIASKESDTAGISSGSSPESILVRNKEEFENL